MQHIELLETKQQKKVSNYFKEFEIRTVKPRDIEEIKSFFIKAYGKDTVFQDERFLKWFFNSEQNKNHFINNCIVCLNNAGQIISYYGGLKHILQIHHEKIPIIWGVNAFTLKEWRGKGINSKMVEMFLRNEINGVIGFSRKTALFYKELGFNIFNYNRFSRFIYILDDFKTQKVIAYIGENVQKYKKITKTLFNSTVQADYPNVIKIDKNNIELYNLCFDVDIAVTTDRNKQFLKWRFIKNPFINYDVYGFVKNNIISAYIALRKDTLSPLNYLVYRIIDLFGAPEHIHHVLNVIKTKAAFENCIYIDFSKIGSLYTRQMISADFFELEEDDVSILPQVSSPVCYRPNNEYIGLKSLKHQQKINLLTSDSIYFTRMDSDRDRLANISQVR